MAGIRREGKWASLECSGPGISHFFREKKLGTQNRDRENRPLEKFTSDISFARISSEKKYILFFIKSNLSFEPLVLSKSSHL